MLSRQCGRFSRHRSTAGRLCLDTPLDTAMILCHIHPCSKTKFYSYFEANPEANFSLLYRQLTLFAPTNAAFQNYKNVNKSDTSSISELINYHLSNQAYTLAQLGSKVSTELTANPPLWVTRRPSPNGQGEDIYVNNAKVNIQKSNFQYTNPNKKKQVLHIIEDVLEPLKSKGDLYNPDAYELLTNYNAFDIHNHTLSKFRKCVEDYGKSSAFKGDARYTFFLPVDEGFQDPINRAGAIDTKIIDGHIIPNHVLFTRPTPFDVKYETLAFGDNVKVFIEFKKESQDKDSRIFISSNTVVGDAKHHTGVVLAEVVMANIPVKNGVVHLISRPLMVVDTSVKAFLERVSQNRGLLSSFYERILDLAPEFLSQIADSETITLFAPNNAAMQSPSLAALFTNKTAFRQVLDLHLIKGKKITSEEVLNKGLTEIPSQLPRKNLYLNVVQREDNTTFSVEGGGVNATVLHPDIASTNGIIHIIDTMLGVPFTTVGRKVATDPQLRSAHKLGEMLHFNDQLDNSRYRYTYFVPRDSAWKKIEIQSPSVYKKVFMQEFAPNVKQILERHLVISDKAYTMADLKQLANVSFTLPSVRDKLEIKVTESEADKSFYISWHNQNIHVYRPDVECINGIIHVIDSVFLTESDIQVNAAPSPLAPLTTLLATGTLLILLRYLH
ncbi:hypothetical protein M8J77_019044 [Diaphorina citri]|nr:hypothetical protein M8J77_019044 [Diaphorina citri]